MSESSTEAKIRPTVYTVGHSNRSAETLLALLARNGIEVLVDARSRPYSRHAPHFSREPLEEAVRAAGLRYLYLGDGLGGRPPRPQCYDAEGRVDYDAVERQDFYRDAVERLMNGVRKFRVCVLCSEEDPARCHRRLLVGRTLLRRGVEVRHLRGDGRIETDAEIEARLAADERQLALL